MLMLFNRLWEILMCAHIPSPPPSPLLSGAGGDDAMMVSCPSLPAVLPIASALPNISYLPDPFIFFNGDRVSNESSWHQCRRTEILQLALYYQYGVYPSPESFVVNGKMTPDNTGMIVNIASHAASVSFTVPVYLPTNNAKPPYPLIIAQIQALLGNDTSINFFTSRGYALLLVDQNGTIAADGPAKTGIFWELFPTYTNRTGTILAWAWAYHRILDVIFSSQAHLFNTAQIGVIGYSRWGKTALLSAALDVRFSMVVPMAAGCAGTGPYRFLYEQQGEAEDLSKIYGVFPYWFSPNLAQFIDAGVGHFPYDMHDVIAAVAPRAILLNGAMQDYWANPEGASVDYRAAKIVYDWLGAGTNIGIAFRNGTHLPIQDSDWHNVIAFADYKLLNKAPSRPFDDPFYPDHPEDYPWKAPN
eukprot:TRINITY_DN5021_c0_g1_i1.p1 TRINITY_DN5021_c0_g1~~TRINITY_DN5021_c0_g1_i1.p1  ORF type:complete len:416 (-),score=62.22 TRINITY_DN5021_c0_g1_i1:76-1323(-)